MQANANKCIKTNKAESYTKKRTIDTDERLHATIYSLPQKKTINKHKKEKKKIIINNN